MEHPAYLPVLSCIQHNLKPRSSSPAPQQWRSLGPQSFAFRRFYSPLKAVQQSRIGHSVDLHVIRLVEVRSRIGNPRRPLRVVGENQQTPARLVQSPQRSDPPQIRGQKGMLLNAVPALTLLLTRSRSRRRWRRLHLAVSIRQPLPHFLRIVLERPVAALISDTSVLIHDIQPLRPC